MSNLLLKQQDSFNISVFIYYIFKWFYAFNKKEMSYEECVARITTLLQAVEEEEETSGGENKVEMKVKTVLVKKNFPFTIGYVP